MNFIAFFEGTERDDQGRLLAHILSWSDYQLEPRHNYVQRLFPLRLASEHDPSAPLLVETARLHLKNSITCQDGIERAVERMMRFWGFESTYFGARDFQFEVPSFKPQWIQAGNHNYKRITRMLTFLRSVESEYIIEPVTDALEIVSQRWRGEIGSLTLRYWDLDFHT